MWKNNKDYNHKQDFTVTRNLLYSTEYGFTWTLTTKTANRNARNVSLSIHFTLLPILEILITLHHWRSYAKHRLFSAENTSDEKVKKHFYNSKINMKTVLHKKCSSNSVQLKTCRINRQKGTKTIISQCKIFFVEAAGSVDSVEQNFTTELLN